MILEMSEWSCFRQKVLIVSLLLGMCLAFLLLNTPKASADTEPNDNINQAETIPASPFSGSLVSQNNDDVYAVLLTQGQRLTVTMTLGASPIQLFLFGPDATDVTTDLEVVHAIRWYDSSPRSIVYTAPSTGNYYLDIWSTADDIYNITYSIGTPSDAPAPHWNGWDIANGLAVRPNGGYYLLDGWGGVHPRLGATYQGAITWSGWDIARAMDCAYKGEGYFTLDGWGGVHPIGEAPYQGAAFFGWDIARDIATDPIDDGYIVLDGFGGVHPFGTLDSYGNPYWPGRDIAKAIDTNPLGTGYYILDAYGGVHPRGTDVDYYGVDYFGWNIARDIAATPSGEGYYVLDGFGGVHAKGDAQFYGPYPGQFQHYWPGWDIARRIEPTISGNGYYVLDGYGGIHCYGDAVP